jgi:microcompartment protein CcmL/EutN
VHGARAEDVRLAGEQGVALARRMGTRADLVIIPGPDPRTRDVSTRPPAFIPLLGIYDCLVPGEDSMNRSDALGLIETQGLVAALPHVQPCAT